MDRLDVITAHWIAPAHRMLRGGLIAAMLASSWVVSGCSSDDNTPAGASGAAGVGGSSGNAGTSGTAGSSGSTAGTAGNAGSSGSGGTAGSAGSAAAGAGGSAGVGGSGGSGGTSSGALEIVPGERIGNVHLGDTLAQLKQVYGPAASAFGANNTLFVSFDGLDLEVVMTSPEPTATTDDARVIAVGTKPTGVYSGIVTPGFSRAQVDAALGLAEATSDSIEYHPEGASVTYDAGDQVNMVAVFAPYSPDTTPQEMGPAVSSGGVRGPGPDPAWIGAIDMHLHPGFVGRIPPATKSFIIGTTPAFTRAYAPGVFREVLDPFAPFVGIRAQTDGAAVSHALLFAVYTHKTTGFFTNEDLEQVLIDPRNVAADGLPWAYGLASINFFDGYVKSDGTVDDQVASARLAALSSYFTARPDLFVGIKLAHAHQAVAFDDARYLGVYDVAEQHAVPVYLHTGFSPFPGSSTDAAFYDPMGLENVITNTPNVVFILGHVGQGDLQAVDHCLAMAESHPNVYLEISALNRPFLKDEHGDQIASPTTEPQYPYVLAQIKERNLASKTIFGTDGPQYSGMVKSYLGLITQAMTDAGFTEEEIQKVLRGNFSKVFFPQ